MKIKALKEKRNAKLAEMTAITDKVAEEVRAITPEEDEKFRALEKEIDDLDKTIDMIENQRAKLAIPDTKDNGDGTGTTEEEEIRAFASYIRWGTQSGTLQRADVNMVNGGPEGTNGAIIPKTIADRIVKRIYEISPILSAATKYTVKGQLDLPFYDETNGAITVEYADEFTDATSHVGKFDKIILNGFLARALTKVSRSLMNGTDVYLVAFVVDDMGLKIARWLEKELLIGTSGKVTGLSTCSQTVTAAATTAITADELIDLQDTVIDYYQSGAMWIMSRATRTAIRKLKDGNDRYLLQDDVTAPFGKTLLGKPVYTSDNMPGLEAGKTAIYYGDFSGLAVKFAEQPTIQVLQELYAPQHAIGVLGFVEVDAKIQVEQAIAQLKMAAA
jgi:HK97 family phage major capsid protein